MLRIKDFIFCKLKGSKGIGIFEFANYISTTKGFRYKLSRTTK
jgi:hypothetical protein